MFLCQVYVLTTSVIVFVVLFLNHKSIIYDHLWGNGVLFCRGFLASFYEILRTTLKTVWVFFVFVPGLCSVVVLFL